MGNMKKVKDVDFIIQSEPLTAAEQEQVNEFISKDKAKRPAKKTVKKQTSAKPREKWMSTADMLIEKGRQQGILDGKREVILEWRLEGKRKGQLEAAREIALAMKLHGMPVDQISKFTNLTVEEINKLK
jgi:predicted transposase/invertase (TIGR01784 family)